MRRLVTRVSFSGLVLLMSALTACGTPPSDSTADSQELVITTETLFDLESFKTIKSSYDSAELELAQVICEQVNEIRDEIGTKDLVAGMNSLSEQEIGYGDKFQDLLYKCSDVEFDKSGDRIRTVSPTETTTPEPESSSHSGVLEYTADDVFSENNVEVLNAFDTGDLATKVIVCMAFAKASENMSDEAIMRRYIAMELSPRTAFDDLVRECSDVLYGRLPNQ